MIGSIFSELMDTVRLATFRDTTRPSWLKYGLLLCYCILPLACVISFLVSWKVALVLGGLFLVSLLVGAMTEEDDIPRR